MMAVDRQRGGKKPVVGLWPGKMPGPEHVVGAEIDTSKPGDGLVAGKPLIRLGNVARAEMHVYLAPASKRNGGAVVVLPGGGYHILAWDLEGTEVAAWLNRLGYAAFVLKYRVPTASQNPKWLGPLIDTQRAVSMVRARAAEWGVSPEKIGVLGFSAGGQTAAIACLKGRERAYAIADDTDRVSCRPDFGVLVYPAYLVDERGALLPEFSPTRECPPIFFAHAADDNVTCQSSVQLFAALQTLKVASELHVWESGGHGYGLRPQKDKPVTEWPVACGKWLERVSG